MRTEHAITIEVHMDEEKYNKLKAIHESNNKFAEKHGQRQFDFDEYIAYGLIDKKDTIMNLLFNRGNMVYADEVTYTYILLKDV